MSAVPGSFALSVVERTTAALPSASAARLGEVPTLPHVGEQALVLRLPAHGLAGQRAGGRFVDLYEARHPGEMRGRFFPAKAPDWNPEFLPDRLSIARMAIPSSATA